MDGGGVDALRHLPRSRGWTWLYRGWLLDEEDATTLWETVLERGDRLVVQPSEVAAAALLPRWAPVLGPLTPASVWTEDDDVDEAWELALTHLGPPPWLVRDHLKSARQWWGRAAFVPPGRRSGGVRRGLRRSARVHGGPVLRRVRRPSLRGPVAWAPYHDIDEVEPMDRVPFPDLGQRVASSFFVADVGRLADGGWTVVELNDGGSARFPDQLDVWEVYHRIFGARARTGG